METIVSPRPVNSTPAPDADATVIMNSPAHGAAPPNVPANPPRSSPSQSSASRLPDFGPRYQVISLLGQGGMGAVYKARDLELDRIVALKLLRPELTPDAGATQRFKQELLLASKISHRNILRIHDLGDSNGVKFISMAYIEGQDLHHILQEHGRLPVKRALHLAKQILAALEAAHTEGVVHRDLKPQNMMVDANDQLYVMDFGLAKSVNTDVRMTMSGQVVGTPQYMAPEQVEGGPIDHRADLYAFGLILDEMLTGELVFKAESAFHLMLARIREAPRSPRTVVPDLPEYLDRIVSRCLMRAPEERYQSAREILDDIASETAGEVRSQETLVLSSVGKTAIAPSKPQFSVRRWAALSAALLVVAGGGIWGWEKFAHPAAGRQGNISVLVADFTNHTGDAVFDSTLEPMLNVALEGANFINAYSRGDARNLAEKLPKPTNKLDEQTAQLVAMSQGINAVITGDITLRGNKYQISAMALDGATGNVLGKAEVSVADEKDVIRELPKLAAPLRRALGDTTPPSVQFNSVSGGFTAANLEAVHFNGLGLEQQFAGNFQSAFEAFKKATELDPNFAQAYSGMAAMASDLGKASDAEKYTQAALQHEDRMTERERYRVRGIYYLSIGNWSKCVDELSQLVKSYPSDRVGQTNLGVCYASMRNFSMAAEVARRAVDLAPQAVVERNNLSFYLTYSGDFEGGDREALKALQINQNSVRAHLAQVEAQLGKGSLAEAAATYKQMQGLGASGASLAASGLADLAAYEGRFTDAINTLQTGITADLAAKDPNGAAEKSATLAHLQYLRGQKAAAIASAGKAISLSKDHAVPARVLAARVFVEAGDIPQAQKLSAALASETDAETQAYGKIIDGEVLLARGDKGRGIATLTEANSLMDTWLGRFDLGWAYLEAGKFVEADSEFERCNRRRGEALELLLDNVPTLAAYPMALYYQGRVREGLKNPAFADSYRAYLNIRGKAGEDPLLPDIRRRLGQ
jgi:tetratricopeptide (TPR) repeat protein